MLNPIPQDYHSYHRVKHMNICSFQVTVNLLLRVSIETWAVIRLERFEIGSSAMSASIEAPDEVAPGTGVDKLFNDISEEGSSERPPDIIISLASSTELSSSCSTFISCIYVLASFLLHSYELNIPWNVWNMDRKGKIQKNNGTSWPKLAWSSPFLIPCCLNIAQPCNTSVTRPYCPNMNQAHRVAILVGKQPSCTGLWR